MLNLYISGGFGYCHQGNFRGVAIARQNNCSHCSFCIKKCFEKLIRHFGVFYPLQSLKKEVSHLPDIPIVIDANDESTLKELEVLAHSISNQVVEAGDVERMKLHLAAVIVNNFVNHLYSLAESYCNNEGLDFTLLLPLIKETAERIHYISPSQTQTGPALRNDRETIEKHLELLKKYPHLKKIYETFTESIYVSR